MGTDLSEKSDRYEQLLAMAIEAVEPSPPDGTPLADVADEFTGMARAYLDDGRHFADADDRVNALAAYAYGHAWLDAGARIGVFAVPEGDHSFAV